MQKNYIWTVIAMTIYFINLTLIRDWMKNTIEKYHLLLKVFFVGMFGSISTRPLFFKKTWTWICWMYTLFSEDQVQHECHVNKLISNLWKSQMEQALLKIWFDIVSTSYFEDVFCIWSNIVYRVHKNSKLFIQYIV